MSKISFYREKNFKKTEIGEIPREWEVRRLGGDICEINPKYKVQKGKFYKFLPMEAVSEDHYKVKFVETRAWKGSGVKYSKGDILLARITPSAENGKTTIVNFLKENEIGIGSTEFIVFKPKNADSFYIYYLLKWDKVRNQLISQMSGTTGRQRIPNDAPHKVKVPYPSKLEEQKNIAKVLKDFDDLLENIEKQIKTLERVKKGLMNIYFTKGVFKHETFKDTELGRIPAEWEVRRLGGDICEINPKYKVQKGKFYKFLPMEAVSEDHYRVKFVEIREWKGSGVKYSQGDILLARITPSAENGKTAIVDFLKENEIGTGSTEFIVFKPKNVDSFYIYYLLKWDKVRNQLISQMSGTTGRQRIPNDAPHKVKVPLPKIQEQKAIAERLKTIDDQIENLKKQKEHLQKVKKKFMELLLTGKIRIKTQ